MRRLDWACASVTLALVIVLSTATHAGAGGGCPYEILVTRQEGRVLSARVCDVGAVVNWLRVTPGAEVSSQAPGGDLRDGFTVTILVQYRPLQPDVLRPLLTERVYPLAEGGPVAFVPLRTIFHEVTAYPRWVVPAGWRTLDASEPVPPVLKRLGMSQPKLGPSSNGGSSRTSPPPLSSVTGSEPRRPTPDLITLAFVLIALATTAALGRRGTARKRKGPQERDATESQVGPRDV